MCVFVYFTFSENFDSIDYKSKGTPSQPRVMPPYNGFGSEEDSLCNCLSLIPKPPKRDFIKFMEKDRLVHFLLLCLQYFDTCLCLFFVPFRNCVTIMGVIEVVICEFKL